jgi:hypothetical protein
MRETPIKLCPSRKINTKHASEEGKPGSVKQDGGDSQHFVENLRPKRLHVSAASRSNAQHPRMIAPHYPGCLSAGESNGEADPFGEFTAIGNRQDHWQSGRFKTSPIRLSGLELNPQNTIAFSVRSRRKTWGGEVGSESRPA